MRKRFSNVFVIGAMTLAAQGAMAVDFTAVGGDGTCPSGTAMVGSDAAMSYQSKACEAIGANASVRLAGGGSMANAAGGCRVKLRDLEQQPATLCDRFVLQVTNGDNSCPAGTRLVTIEEAALFNGQACAALGQSMVARLDGGASLSGSALNCVVVASQPQKLSNSLCTPPSLNAAKSK